MFESRKYSLNLDYFKSMEDWEPHQAYFFGWLATDGSVGNGQFRIRIQEKDKEVLDYLKAKIEYAGPLIYEKRNPKNNNWNTTNQNRFCLSISSVRVCEDLKMLGLIPNKADKFVWPAALPQKSWRGFLLGLYEGDGTVSLQNRKGSKGHLMNVNLLGSFELLSKVKEILLDNTDINTINLKRCAKIKIELYNLRIHGIMNALKFFNFVYKDANFVLKRKFQKFIIAANFVAQNVENFPRKKETLAAQIAEEALKISEAINAKLSQLNYT